MSCSPTPHPPAHPNGDPETSGEEAAAKSPEDPRPALSVHGLGKNYHIYKKPEDRLKQALWRGRRRYYREFWALRGVSFEIYAGHTVGVVGENGSGKSTLLEILAGTLEPSRGACHVRGRVAALLELGTGFNPDFSGRENVFLTAAVVGLSRQETQSRYPDILDFAAIGDFIHQPVKTYSAGMLLRLAFAIAVSVEPDILIIDEVLAVGDEAFQRKCFSRLEKIRDGGATVLFASHDPTAVLSLCTQVLLLDHGEKLLFGEPKKVVETYQRLLFAAPGRRDAMRREILEHGHALEDLGAGARSFEASRGTTEPPGPPPANRPRPEARARFDPGLVPQSTVRYEPRGAEITAVELLDLDLQPVNVLVRGEEYLYRYRVSFATTRRRVRFGMLLKTRAGFELGGSSSSVPSQSVPEIAAGGSVLVEFRFACRLLPGVYFLNAGVLARLGEEETYLHRILDAVAFRVRPEGELKETGLVDFGVTPRVVIEG